MVAPAMSRLAVVDTSVASLWYKKRLPEGVGYLRLVKGYTLSFPSVVAGELLYGAYSNRWSERNITALQAYISEFEPLAIRQDTADWWAWLRSRCRRRGIAASENDTWIAATALSLNCVLVSHDRDHLRMRVAVPRLQVLSLLKP